ncbi:MAG: Gfo/Idh/MocA family oxidoreductase [Planctomycetaceae bacterium]|nr:Gfo/Idh/MocA family oxidoreductase [Planctomycetaceae bacterium]
MSDKIRIGLIGAGMNTKLRHLPGFLRIDGVEVVGVVNRTAESTAAVAREFGISKTYASGDELIQDPEIDAVCIGTWPNTHCELTTRALEAGKHVLCEARMAANLADGRKMLECAQRHPELIAQIVPSPFGLKCGPTVANLVKSHFLGDLREVVVLAANNQFWDYSEPLHWRQDQAISGRNILALGILQETLARWVPSPVQVFAQSEIFEPTRPVPDESRFAEATVPDSVQIVAELQGGARALYHISGVILFGPGLQIHLYGSRGTIKVNFNDGEERVHAGRSEDSELTELEIPDEEQGTWRVEEDFICAIRGERKVQLTDLKTALGYMEFLEAVALSAEQNVPIELPLD